MPRFAAPRNVSFGAASAAGAIASISLNGAQESGWNGRPPVLAWVRLESLPEEVTKRDEARPEAEVKTAGTAGSQGPRLAQRLSDEADEESQV